LVRVVGREARQVGFSKFKSAVCAYNWELLESFFLLLFCGSGMSRKVQHHWFQLVPGWKIAMIFCSRPQIHEQIFMNAALTRGRSNFFFPLQIVWVMTKKQTEENFFVCVH
jgi:hypothetical protein